MPLFIPFLENLINIHYLLPLFLHKLVLVRCFLKFIIVAIKGIVLAVSMVVCLVLQHIEEVFNMCIIGGSKFAITDKHPELWILEFLL